MRWWRHSWPGLLATLDGVGLCRFAYTPLIPFMIGAGVVSETGAAYLGAANLAGYLAGAASAAPLAGIVGLPRAIRGSFLVSVVALGACAWPGGFWWYFPWRFLAGGVGAALMVLAPSFLLSEVPPGERGRHGGVIYGGVGAGIALSSLLVPPLAGWSLAGVWAALALGALVTTLATWRRWRGRAVIVSALSGRPRLGAAAWLVALAFGMDGVGFVPHNLFWVDYIARSLGRGTAVGAAQWLLLGVGAAIGPAVAGRIGDGIGIGRALILAFAVKCLVVVLPSVATSLPLLSLSSVITGALTPGIAALCAARITTLVAPGLQTRAGASPPWCSASSRRSAPTPWPLPMASCTATRRSTRQGPDSRLWGRFLRCWPWFRPANRPRLPAKADFRRRRGGFPRQSGSPPVAPGNGPDHSFRRTNQISRGICK